MCKRRKRLSEESYILLRDKIIQENNYNSNLWLLSLLIYFIIQDKDTITLNRFFVEKGSYPTTTSYDNMIKVISKPHYTLWEKETTKCVLPKRR